MAILYEADFRNECKESILAELSGANSGQTVLLKGQEEYEDWSMCL